MDLVQTGAQLLQNKFGDDIQTESIVSALSEMLGGDNFNVGSLISKIQGDAGLASIAASWLGSGENSSITTAQVIDIFGQEKVSNFASKLNIDDDTASSGLADMLPQLIEQSSTDGTLLDSLSSAGSSSGLMGMVGKMFGR